MADLPPGGPVVQQAAAQIDLDARIQASMEFAHDE
jgi:hypothetical protein